MNNTPECRLWNAVIIEFLRDIAYTRLEMKELSNGRLAGLESKLEQYIYQVNHCHFKMICGFAGFDYKKIRSRILKIISGEIVIKTPFHHHYYLDN